MSLRPSSWIPAGLLAVLVLVSPLPFGSIVRDKLLTAAARGMEDLDWAAVSEISRAQAGLE